MILLDVLQENTGGFKYDLGKVIHVVYIFLHVILKYVTALNKSNTGRL